MTDDDRTWIRSLPLLFTASVLLIAGAFSFWKNGNDTLSITAASVGVFLLGTWSATAVADWSKHHRITRNNSKDVASKQEEQR